MFRTAITMKPVERPISLDSKILSMGSCFADFIGGQLKKNKFNIVTNPFGVIFHPLAQFEILKLALNHELPADHSYLRNQNIWYNYLFHSSISHASRANLENDIKQRIEDLRIRLAEADFLLLTFGTAIQYRHKNSGMLVANCHKVPGREFDKGLTAVETLVDGFQQLLVSMEDHHPHIIISVSPIRHLKEGIENNCVSKSALRVACQQIVERHPHITYFPGYEIMMDDLRDYRFFEKDMIHPNETAREYIWELFRSCYLDRNAQNFVDQWGKIAQNLDHRPFHPQSAAYQDFIRKTLALIEKLPAGIDTTKEVELLKISLK